MREVHRSCSAVTAQPRHWTMVALEHLRDASLAVVAEHKQNQLSQHAAFNPLNDFAFDEKEQLWLLLS